MHVRRLQTTLSRRWRGPLLGESVDAPGLTGMRQQLPSAWLRKPDVPRAAANVSNERRRRPVSISQRTFDQHCEAGLTVVGALVDDGRDHRRNALEAPQHSKVAAHKSEHLQASSARGWPELRINAG